MARASFYNKGAGWNYKVKTFTLTLYPAQVFSSEVSEIFKNTFETPTIL